MRVAVKEVNAELEEVPCDLCGGNDAVTVTQSEDYWHGLPGQFNIVRCRQCGLIYLSPRPTPHVIGSFYPSDYYAFGAPGQGDRDGLRKQIKRRIRASRWLSTIATHLPVLQAAARDEYIKDDIPEWIPPGTVLDVGCGSGAFLDTMSDVGWRTVGLEPNPAAAATARERGHEVFCQIATEPLPSDTLFDLIVVSHTLEHVHSPRLVLTSLNRLLRPVTGRLLIEVPNVESLFTKLFHGLGTAYDTPRHLYLFSPSTLQRLLVETGFAVRRIRHRSSPQQIVKSLVLVCKLFPIADTQDAAQSILADPELLAAFQPLVDLAQVRHEGGALRVVAVRSA
jgi:SAM-dependent methyltransferase